MNKLEKLFRKLSSKDGALLRTIIGQLEQGKTKGLNIIKVTGTDFYRLKKRHFRIIYHFEHGEAIIDSVRLRNEKTYKNL